MFNRVFTFVLFSFAMLFVFGCGGDDPVPIADNNQSPVASSATKAPSQPEVKPRRGKPPIESRTTRPSEREVNNGRDAEPRESVESRDKPSSTTGDMASAKSKNERLGSDSKGDAAADAAPKKNSKSSSTHNDAADAVKVPEMAEASGKEGVMAGDTIIEIKGKDIDGESFALSDYAGKVILLDFWGDW